MALGLFEDAMTGLDLPCYAEKLPNGITFLNELFATESSVNTLTTIVLAKGKMVTEISTKEISKVTKKHSPKKTDVDLDLTGSPLKASFTLDEDDEMEDDYRVVTMSKKRDGLNLDPMTTRFARQVISKLNITTQNMNETPQIWALCNNDDSTMFLGSKRCRDKGFVVSKVLYSGTMCCSQSESTMFDLILAKHEETSSSLCDEAKTSCEAMATYNLVENVSNDSCLQEEACSLLLRFKWPRPRDVFELPPCGSSVVELEAKFLAGDPKMACYSAYKELQLLKGLNNGLQNRGIEWRKRKASENCPTLSEELEELLIGKVKQNGPRSAMQANKINQNSKSVDDVDTLLLDERNDVDLTDLLWAVLQKAESFSELCEAWHQVFNTIRREEIRPYIYSRNTTKAAEIVQGLIRGNSSPISPDMAKSWPLEMLVEIGIEKLRRDYVHTILTNFLAARSDLDYFLNSGQDTGDALLKLEKLHKIQELICLCQTYLSPGQECLRSIVVQAIKFLQADTDDSETVKLSMSINGSHVKDQIAKICPSVWQCTFSTIGNEAEVKTTCHLSVEQPTDSVPIIDGNKNEEDENEDDSVEYHLTTGIQISRKNM